MLQRRRRAGLQHELSRIESQLPGQQQEPGSCSGQALEMESLWEAVTGMSLQ